MVENSDFLPPEPCDSDSCDSCDTSAGAAADVPYLPSRAGALELVEELRELLGRVEAIAEAGKQWIRPETDEIARNLFECIAREARDFSDGYALQRYIEARG
jgi:hypothetical protein